METKIEFATGAAVTGKTPKALIYAFRASILITTAVSAWIGATHLISDAAKVEVILILKGIDFIVWGIGRMTGIVKDDDSSK